MVEVLEPLEVGDRHTTGVDVHVWDDQATVLSQNVVTSGSNGAVSRLGNDLSLCNEKIVNTRRLLNVKTCFKAYTIESLQQRVVYKTIHDVC